MSDDEGVTSSNHPSRPAFCEQWRDGWTAFRYSMFVGTFVVLCLFLILLTIPAITYWQNGEWWFPYLQDFGSFLFAVGFGMSSATAFFARLKSCKLEDELATLIIGIVPVLMLLRLFGIDFEDSRDKHPTQLLHPFLFICILLFPWCSGFFWKSIGRVLQRSSPPMIMPEE